MTKHGELIGIAAAIVSSLIFGLYPAAIRGAYADGANAVFMIVFTMFWRTASITGFCFLTKRPLFPDANRRKIGLQNGIFQTLSIVGVLGGMAFLPGPVVITVLFSYVLIIYAIVILRGEEKLNAAVLISVIAALIGLGLVVGVQSKIDQHMSLLGLALAVMAALAAANRIYYFGKQLKQHDPMAVGAETSVVALALLCLTVFVQWPDAPQTLQGWGWSALGALSLALGNFAMFYGLSKIDSFKYAFFAKLEPVFAALFAALLIGEVLTITQYVGIGLVFASLLAYQMLGKRAVV